MLASTAQSPAQQHALTMVGLSVENMGKVAEGKGRPLRVNVQPCAAAGNASKSVAPLVEVGASAERCWRWAELELLVAGVSGSRQGSGKAEPSQAGSTCHRGPERSSRD